MDPVADHWRPVPIEWLPETVSRPESDFPQFWSGIVCVSKRAVEAVGSYLRVAGEMLPLAGLGDEFVGFHCLHTADVIDQGATDLAIKDRKGISFASPSFAPTLRRHLLPIDCEVFRIPQSFAKVFVGMDFKMTYDRNGLRGLQFLEVPLV